MIPPGSPEELRVQEEEGAQIKTNKIVQFNLDRMDQKISAKTTFVCFFSGEKSFQEAPQKVEVGDTFFYNILHMIIQEKNIFHNFKLQNSCEKVLKVHNSDNRKICEPQKNNSNAKGKRLSSRWVSARCIRFHQPRHQRVTKLMIGSILVHFCCLPWVLLRVIKWDPFEKDQTSSKCMVILRDFHLIVHCLGLEIMI